MRRRFRTLVILLLTVSLLIYVYHYCSNDKHGQSTNISDNVVNIGFSQFDLLQHKQRETELEQKYNLTAILLVWKRSVRARALVRKLTNSVFFKEVIIWNNNPSITLESTSFHSAPSSQSTIRIINSKENLKDEAKYRACAEAKTVACFYVDDDWDVSPYLRSLIASFRADPYVLHSVTDLYTFYTNLMWSYFDAQIDLHTGFSWIGCGSIFLREYAQQHLHYLHTYLAHNRGEQRMIMSRNSIDVHSQI